MKMDSKTAKALIKQRARSYGNDFAGAVEEVTNTWSADIIAVKWAGEIVEYEIKCSKADLAGEIKAILAATRSDTFVDAPRYSHSFLREGEIMPTKKIIRTDTKLSQSKIEKHHYYLAEPINRIDMYYRSKFRPHKFYFAVPTELIEIAKELLKPVKQYGIYNIDTGQIVKNARRLHYDEIPGSVYFDLFTRACTERNDVESAYRAETYFREVYNNGEQIKVRVA